MVMPAGAEFGISPGQQGPGGVMSSLSQSLLQTRGPAGCWLSAASCLAPIRPLGGPCAPPPPGLWCWMSSPITGADLEAYSRDGFVLKRGLYSRDEMQLLRDIAKGEQSGFRTGTGRSRASEATAAAKGVPQQLNPLGRPRMSEIYHFERHDRALVSPSIYDALLFGERMVHCMECLILRPDDESRHRGTYQAVTLHHRKLTMKDVHSFLPDEQSTRRADNGQGQPGYTDASTGEAHRSQHSGNRWQWHQDYGYWYGNGGVGGPFPDMVIACVGESP
jgi:hypothetical protein